MPIMTERKNQSNREQTGITPGLNTCLQRGRCGLFGFITSATKKCFNQTVIPNIKLKASCNLLTPQEIRVELEPNFKDKEKAMWTINVV